MKDEDIPWRKIYNEEDLAKARAAPKPEPKLKPNGKKGKRKWWPGKKETR